MTFSRYWWIGLSWSGFVCAALNSFRDNTAHTDALQITSLIVFVGGAIVAELKAGREDRHDR